MRGADRADRPPAAPAPVTRALVILVGVLAVGTGGYAAFGLSPLDALYQAVTTISTVGFREVEPFDAGEKTFTIVLVLCGVGAALYAFTAVLEAVVEGRLSESVGRRRMERRIEQMDDHVIVCGWGRVGQAVAAYLDGSGRDYVIVDRDAERLSDLTHPNVVGDANEDAVLRAAGIDRAKVLVAALTTDSDNLFVTLSARSLRADLFIVARARHVDTQSKLLQAGADRVVNPQHIGGTRMAAFASQQHVVEFLDIVMHDGSLEFRLEEVPVPAGSGLDGRTLRDSQIRDRTGALVLALRDDDGTFQTNPAPDTTLHAGQVMIAIGTHQQLSDLSEACR
jgi:voltage-gated potassium channel